MSAAGGSQGAPEDADLASLLWRAVSKIESRLLGEGGQAFCTRLDFNDVGIPWLLYDLTGKEQYARLARQVFARLAEGDGWTRPGENNGFRIYYSGVLGYKLTGEDRFGCEVTRGLEVTERIYEPGAGAFLSSSHTSGQGWFKGQHTMLIDTGATLNPFLWAAGNDPRYRRMLDSHFRRVLAEHVRPDGSTIQAVMLDPRTGQAVGKRTVQGYDVDSCWARGQAWGIYGYASAYEVLGDELFLSTAETLADWYIDHLPPEAVPHYDFLDPHIPDAPRDTSAAAIACAGMLRLCRSRPGAPPRYRQTVQATMRALAADYLTPRDDNDASGPGMLLGGCWGRFSDEMIEARRSFVHKENTGSGQFYVWKRNIVLPESGELFYALGFFVEALHRLLKPDSDLLDF